MARLDLAALLGILGIPRACVDACWRGSVAGLHAGYWVAQQVWYSGLLVVLPDVLPGSALLPISLGSVSPLLVEEALCSVSKAPLWGNISAYCRDFVCHNQHNETGRLGTDGPSWHASDFGRIRTIFRLLLHMRSCGARHHMCHMCPSPLCSDMPCDPTCGI